MLRPPEHAPISTHFGKADVEVASVILKGARKIPLFLVIAVAVLLADRLTKQWVIASIPLHSGYELIPGFMNLVHARNPGAAFGFLSQSAATWRSALFLVISAAAAVAILWLVFSAREIEAHLLVGYALFFSGAVGNLIDRVMYGEVIDFLDVYVKAWHWPAFNVADSALCVGTALFFLHLLVFGPREQKSSRC